MEEIKKLIVEITKKDILIALYLDGKEKFTLGEVEELINNAKIK